MYWKKFMKAATVALAALFFILTGGMMAAAHAFGTTFSVDVDNLTYSDGSGRWVAYDFANGALTGPILLDDSVAEITRPSGESNSSYFWGEAVGLPAVSVERKTDVGKAAVGPVSPATTGVAVLYAGGPGAVIPPATTPASWFYTMELSNFNVDLAAQKAYRFSVGLGKDEKTMGAHNNASVSVVWVKGFLDGAMYESDTLIIQARVQNGDADIWQSLPIIRTGLSPATTTLMFDLSVQNGNNFTAAVKINDEDMQNLLDASNNGCTLTTEQGTFQSFPDLYPYLYMEEESASTAPQAQVQSQHWQNGYYASFYVADPLHKAASVVVTGGNLGAGGVNLTWNDVNKSWWTASPDSLGTALPTTFPSYVFAFTPQTGQPAIDSATRSVTGYVTEFATNLLPSGDVSTTPTFSWTAAPGTISGYGIEVREHESQNHVWSFYGIPPTQTSISYLGIPLENGKTYDYNIITHVEQNDVWNSSFAQGSFTWTGSGGGTVTGGVGLILDYPGGAPPYGFSFSTATLGSVSSFAADFMVNGYAGASAPYSATGMPNVGVTFLNMGPMTQEAFAGMTFPPTAGFQTVASITLTPGNAYAFRMADGSVGTLFVQSVAVNGAAVSMTFDYAYFPPGSGPATIAFNGATATIANWPATTAPPAPIAGAAITAREVVFPLSAGVSLGTATSGATGAFTVSGIPALSTFFLDITPPTTMAGHMPVLSKFMNWNDDIDALLPFVFFSSEQNAAFANGTGNGMIVGRVALASNPGAFLSGATILAQAWNPPVPPATQPTLGQTYAVTYADGGTATGADGVYMVKDVPDGTLIQLVATLANHAFQFNGSIVPVKSGYISEDSFFATPLTVSTFTSETAFDTAYPGATLIDFNEIDTSQAHVNFSGYEYESSGIIFTSPVHAQLYVEPPPTSNWVWNSNYLSPGGAPFVGGDDNNDSLAFDFSTPVMAVGWKFLEIPDFSAVDIRLYDAQGNLIHESLNGAGMVASTTSDSAFWGYASSTPIARVVITDTANNGDDVGYDDFRFVAPTSSGVSFAGALMNADGSAPIGGATVEMAGNGSISTTTDTTTGIFNLTGLPSNELFAVRMSSEGYIPTYSQSIQTTAPITAARTYNLYTATDLATWGTAANTAVIQGRVMNANNLQAGYISGAVVGYTSSLGRTDYPVRYVDPAGNLVSGERTYANGKFAILDVAEGDIVTVTAQNTYYPVTQATVFGNTTDRTHADSVYQGLVRVAHDTGWVAIGGRIMNTANPAVGIGGAYVGEVGSTIPVNATVSNGDGSFYLTVLAGWPVQVKFEKPQDTTLAPTYTGYMEFSADVPALGDFNLFAKTTLATWGVTETTGIIRARVKDASGGYIGGATVTATGAGGTQYQVCYDDACTLAATDSTTGRYIVKGVVNEDSVVVTAQKSGYAFNTRTFAIHGGAMHQGSITGSLFTDPVISGLSQISGSYGSSVVISGANFGSTQGKVLIGGYASGTTITEWTATAITVVATRSGQLTVVTSGGVSSAPSTQVFQITSPYYNVNVVNPEVQVFKNEKAEFVAGVPFFNSFSTSAGITLALQNGNAATLNGAAIFIPGVTLTGSGGVVIRIDTSGLAAGTYTANLVASSAEQTFDAGTVTLKVIAVGAASGLRFYEFASDSSKSYLTSKELTKQGQFYLYVDVFDDQGALAFDGSYPFVNPVNITSSDPLKVITWKDDYGRQFRAQENGTVDITASLGGVTATLPVTVNFPVSPQVTSIGLLPQTVTNKYEDVISFSAVGTGSIGYEVPWTLPMKEDDFNLYDSNTRVGGTFKLDLTTPPNPGSYYFQASAGDYSTTAGKVVPLVVTNDPSYATIKGGIRPLDIALGVYMLEHFTLRFYDASTGAFAFARDFSSYAHGWPDFSLGAIVPGTYKILYVPMGDVKPQWWPNAANMGAAAPVVFTAGQTVNDIIFFAASQPQDATVTLPPTPMRAFTQTGGAGDIPVGSDDSGYVWSASSDSPWIKVVSGITGAGNGTVSYTVEANPFGAGRSGMITIAGQFYTITQDGTGNIPPWVGTWGTQQLVHFDGEDVPWYAEIAKTVLNEDGTGTLTTTKNDHNGQLINSTVSFNYTMTPNPDGSLTFAANVGEGEEQIPITMRMVIGDGGRMGVADGTSGAGRQMLMTLYRLDPYKSYSSWDLSGEYYGIGFERNNTAVYDPPYGNGSYSAVATIHNFSGDGNFDFYGSANTLTSGNANEIWHAYEKMNQTYAVASDGKITAPSGGGFGGWLTGDGAVGGGGGTFVNAVNNQSAAFFLKKQDRAIGYRTADLAGKWALVSIGQDSKSIDGTIQGFYASFGTMICDTAGNCGVHVRNRNSDASATTITSEQLLLKVYYDGSLGLSFGTKSPYYAGAIGNDGNTILLNPSFRFEDGADPWNREIVIGIRASGVGDLAGGGDFFKGDVNGDGRIGMDDAVATMKTIAGQTEAGVRGDYAVSGTDVNGDGYPGPHELLYILQTLGGLREVPQVLPQ